MCSCVTVVRPGNDTGNNFLSLSFVLLHYYYYYYYYYYYFTKPQRVQETSNFFCSPSFFGALEFCITRLARRNFSRYMEIAHSLFFDTHARVHLDIKRSIHTHTISLTAKTNATQRSRLSIRRRMRHVTQNFASQFLRFSNRICPYRQI